MTDHKTTGLTIHTIYESLMNLSNFCSENICNCMHGVPEACPFMLEDEEYGERCVLSHYSPSDWKNKFDLVSKNVYGIEIREPDLSEIISSMMGKEATNDV